MLSINMQQDAKKVQSYLNKVQVYSHNWIQVSIQK